MSASSFIVVVAQRFHRSRVIGATFLKYLKRDKPCIGIVGKGLHIRLGQESAQYSCLLLLGRLLLGVESNRVWIYVTA